MMSLESFRKIIDEIAPYTYWVDLYNRGEPLVNPAAIGMIAYAHAHNIAVKMSTNLHFLDEQRAEQLIHSGLDYLVVPLDGGTQETYEKYRVGGSLETVLNNLNLIVKKKRELNSLTPYITIRTLVMKHNEHEMYTIRTLAREIGVDNLIFSLMIANVEKDSVVEEWLPIDENYSWYDYEQRTNKITGGLHSCSELWQRMTINWDGSVFPCCFVDKEEMSFGNVSSETIRAVWNNRAYTNSRRVFDKDYKPDGIVTICSTCRGDMKRK
jgi:radical SAM protein with 4Fe4S-binding SPASM domain